MHHLFPLLVRELARFVRELVRWTLVGLVIFAGMWLLIDGIPRLASVIIGQKPVRVIDSAQSRINSRHHLPSLRGDL